MKKLIKLDFNNTTRERKTEDSYSELYSHDKNNGSFEFEILNDTLTTEQVIALFKFTESNKIWKTTGTVEGNKAKVTFDTSLITQNETVICYLYFDEEQRTSDTFRFKFKVKVSEIDKMNRYEVKERFINNTVIVDRLDVVTKEELKEALKNVGGIATEGLLTEVKAEELYAKKSEAVDNTNFELVKNRVLALELKTDKDTVYDDSELKGRISVLEAKEDNNTIYDDTNVRERLTALESKPNVDVNNLVTKDELASKNYLTEHQDTSNFALKSEIPQQYNDTEVKERLTTLENKAPVDLSNYATKEELRNVSGSQPLADNLVTKEELEAKHYISDVSNLATKEELQEVRNSQPTVDTSHLVTKDELESKGYLTTHQDLTEYAKKSELYNDSDLKARVEVLEQKTDKDTVYDDTPLKERVTALESKAIEGGAYDDSDLRNRVVALETKEDKDTKYDDTEVKHRLTELENKPAVDTSFFVTEEKLNSKGYISDISGLATKQELANAVTKDELEAKHYVTEEELNNKAYLTQQNLDNYALKSELPTPYNDSLLNERVTALESKGYIKDVSNLVTKEELESKNYLTTPYNDTPLKERVEVLENKVDKDTIYNDTELRNRVEVLENKPNVDLSNYVTSEQLENKHYLTQHQPLDNLVTKEELNSKGYVTDEVLNSKGYLTEHQNISHLVTRDELNGKGYLTEEVLNTKNYLTQHQDLSNLVTKQELENKHYLTEHQNISYLVSKDELETKGYLTQHQSLEEYAKKSELYNDTDIKQRLTTLENKPNIDTSNFVTNEQLEGKHYLTEHQSLTYLATTSDLEALKNIAVSKAELSKKLDTTEYNSFKDSVVTKTELAEKGYLTTHQDISNLVTKEELHEATEIDYSNIVTTDELEPYAKKSELPAPYNDSALVSRVSALESKQDKDTVYNDTEVKQRLTALESRPTSQSEMRGTGMPNGVVEAPIGATYIDTAKTNGALKWIKTTDGGNTGWKVSEGDTGWVLGWQNDKGNNKNRMYFRRKNDVVHVKFEPEINNNSISPEFNLILDANGVDISYNLSIQGFQPVDNIIQAIFKRPIDIYGELYNTENSEYSQGTGAVILHYSYNGNPKRGLELFIATNQLGVEKNHVNPFSYLTEDEWPVQLP